ncbi:MAG: NAD(P)/FAD-dependent oxidoreductase, partial [Planctomycetota bacterium]
KKHRVTLLENIKSLRLPVSGTRGFAKAEVTAGGVDLSEVDPKSMRSRRHEGLFIAGEVLDVDGPIGGYNFQAAFASGRLAAQAAADWLLGL